MSEKGPVSFAMVCEAPADARTASELADRVACKSVAAMEIKGKWNGLTEYFAEIRDTISPLFVT